MEIKHRVAGTTFSLAIDGGTYKVLGFTLPERDGGQIDNTDVSASSEVLEDDGVDTISNLVIECAYDPTQAWPTRGSVDTATLDLQGRGLLHSLPNAVLKKRGSITGNAREGFRRTMEWYPAGGYTEDVILGAL